MDRTGAREKSLEELMRLAQQGDKKAYASLFREITPLLQGFVGKRLNNPSDVNDVVQEILLSIHHAGHTYDTDRPFKTWMFTIARYRLNDYLRKLYGKEGRVNVNFDDLAYEISSSENVTKQHEDREYLDKMLDSLPEKQRKIVTMMKIEGYTAEETAKKMKMSVSAVKVSAHRAYKALATKFDESEI